MVACVTAAAGVSDSFDDDAVGAGELDSVAIFTTALYSRTVIVSVVLRWLIEKKSAIAYRRLQ